MSEVRVVGQNDDKISASLRFQEWCKSFSPDAGLTNVYEKWSRFSRNGKLIFALFQVGGRYVFFRPDAVAVFLVVKDSSTQEKYIVLVEQLRVPTGGNLLEIPAGVIDEYECGSDGLAAQAFTAVKEVKEETGLKIDARNLDILGTYYLSPGACNEKITFFYCEIELSGQEISSLHDRLAGLAAEGEKTRVKLVKPKEFKKLDIRDAKTQLAYELCRRRMQKRGNGKCQAENKEATKEWLIMQYRWYAHVDLEKAPWFIRWLDKLNDRGHQTFLADCIRCGGSGKVKGILESQEKVCDSCGGEGTIIGPTYCHKCSLLKIADPVNCGY